MTNITINGLKIPIPEKSTVKDVVERFFDLRCEILVSKNSKPIHESLYKKSKIRENDILQVITYSKNCYKMKKRTIIKTEN